MESIILGRTGLTVSRSGFGALPIQRVDFETAEGILIRAYENGINFFDTARGYTDSEEKIGRALAGVRNNIVIATKCSGAKNRSEVLEMVEQSLASLRTDYIDILQLHNPDTLPDPDDPESTYAGLEELRRKGIVRFLGMTNHSRNKALKAAESGLYDTIQFPLSAISSEEDFELVLRCSELNIGFIAMKALCGGLLNDSEIAFAGIRKYPNVLPIWGIQRMGELDEFLALEKSPPLLTPDLEARIAAERAALSGDFCRGCGYCLPCPVDIPIPMAARMGLLVKRMPGEIFRKPEWKEKMSRVEYCQHCNSCSSKCPYGLDTPALLQKNFAAYSEWMS